MEKGLVLALFAAASFGANTVFVRKAVVLAGESFTAVAMSVFIGVGFFAISASISQEWGMLRSLTWQAFVMLALAGIIHFVAGRLLSYNSYRLIGANKSSALFLTSPFYTLVIGVIFLDEAFTVSLVAGVLLIFAGATLVSTERKSVSGEKQSGEKRDKKKWFRQTEAKGILAALGAAVFWGISPILIRAVARETGSPSVSAFVSYIAASIVMAFFFSRRQHREQISHFRFSGALSPIFIAGILVSTAHLLNYAALGFSPASVVTPLISTHVLFVFLFSFIIIRSIEIFTPKVLMGMLATIVGTFLIFYF